MWANVSAHTDYTLERDRTYEGRRAGGQTGKKPKNKPTFKLKRSPGQLTHILLLIHIHGDGFALT